MIKKTVIIPAPQYHNNKLISMLIKILLFYHKKPFSIIVTYVNVLFLRAVCAVSLDGILNKGLVEYYLDNY